MTSPKQTPNRDWLAFVTTSRARQRIRQWIRKEEFDRPWSWGRRSWTGPSGRPGRTGRGRTGWARWPRLWATATASHLYDVLGRGDLGPTVVMKELFPDQDAGKTPERAPTAARAHQRRAHQVGPRGAHPGHGQPHGALLPVLPAGAGGQGGGVHHRGRGVSIHRVDCPNILHLSQDGDRRVEIEWSAEQGERFFVKLRMHGSDRRGLLSDVAKAISDTGTDIQHADMRASEVGWMPSSWWR
jgi:GTP diphosphokinase / guanosine-3',5'-bis(diphosphate) 3'-diphosphatase